MIELTWSNRAIVGSSGASGGKRVLSRLRRSRNGLARSESPLRYMRL